MPNPNHPKLGSRTKVEPIRELSAIQRIKTMLRSNPRNYALFITGINTAFRASDLLALKVRHVQDLYEGDSIEHAEIKTSKLRRVTLNDSVIESVRYLIKSESLSEDDWLFQGRDGVLRVPTLVNLVKTWCRNVGLKGNYGSHSLRKTWGYHQRVTFNSDIPTLMMAFGHSTQKQTLDYLCVQQSEIKDLYMNAL